MSKNSADNPTDPPPSYEQSRQPQPRQHGQQQASNENPSQRGQVQIHQVQQQEVVPLPLAFDHHEPKYKCCCGCMHVKIGVIVIGILSCIYIGLCILGAMLLIAENATFGYIKLAVWCSFIPGVISLFIGICTKNRYLLLPYIICAIIFAIANIIITIIYIILLLVYTPEVKEEAERIASSTYKNEHVQAAIGWIIVWEVIETIFQVSFIAWFTWVVFKCYRYYRDLKNYSGKAFIGHEP